MREFTITIKTAVDETIFKERIDELRGNEVFAQLNEKEQEAINTGGFLGGLMLDLAKRISRNEAMLLPGNSFSLGKATDKDFYAVVEVSE